VGLACDVRYVGQYHELTVEWLDEEFEGDDLSGLAKRFHEAHDRHYGYALPDTPLELVNVRAVALGHTFAVPPPEIARGGAAAARRGHRRAWVAESATFSDASVYDGAALGAGARLAGPAIVELPTTTVVVPPRWRLEVDRFGSFLVERA
jgi:N-methylhydantoinase A